MPPLNPHSSEYSEDTLIEQPAIELLGSLGWETANLFYETFGEAGTEGRHSDREVILTRRLRTSLEKLNPNLQTAAYDQAIDELTRDRSAMIPVNAAQDFYHLLKDGVRDIKVKDELGNESYETLKVIDWESPSNNDFVLASQFWVRGDLYRRRCDLAGFINGLPLTFFELKAAHKRLKKAFDENLRAYKNDIPLLFIPNALIVLSNGSETRLGSLTSAWEHFFEWPLKTAYQRRPSRRSRTRFLKDVSSGGAAGRNLPNYDRDRSIDNVPDPYLTATLTATPGALRGHLGHLIHLTH